MIAISCLACDPEMRMGLRLVLFATLGVSLQAVLSGLAFAASGGPVCVIIRGSDSDAFLNQTFVDDAKATTELYQKAGYQVIELDDSVDHPLTADIIKATIVGIKSSELQLMLITHGTSNEKHEFNLQPATLSQISLISGTQIKAVLLEVK